MKKICSKCKIEKPFEDFYADNRSGDGFRSACKECHYLTGRPSKIRNRERTNKAQRKAYWENPEKHRVKSRKYRSENKEHFDEYNKGWKKANRQKVKEYNLRYRKEHKTEILERTRRYVAKRRLDDPTFRIKQSLRNRLGNALKGKIKHSRTLDLLGCSLDEFKAHLEKNWRDGMNWGNYGVKGWHIDHIVPCCDFDLNTLEGQKSCFHFSNLQPLWWKDNLKKGSSRLP